MRGVIFFSFLLALKGMARQILMIQCALIPVYQATLYCFLDYYQKEKKFLVYELMENDKYRERHGLDGKEFDDIYYKGNDITTAEAVVILKELEEKIDRVKTLSPIHQISRLFQNE